jgi:protocatechuate 3,4-dioxygenase beta subunit
MMTRIGFLALLLIPTLAQASPSRMKIAADNEPGQRMLITGHVFDADGRPRGGLQLYAYHTDAQGQYNRDAQGVARLHGTLVTANDGHYTIDTIKPGQYPGRKIPAHIHIHLREPGFDQEEEIQFTESMRPDSDGVYRVRKDFRLRSKR